MKTLWKYLITGCFALLFTFSQQALARTPKNTQVRPKPLAELPISIINNRVQLDFLVGGMPIAILLDTGATSSIFFQSSHIDSLAPKFLGEANISFPAISRAINAQRIEALSLRLQNFEFISRGGLYIGADAAISNQLDAEYDAILGQEFFKAFVVEIDPLAKSMRLYPPGTNLEQYFNIKQKLFMEGHTPHIRFFSRMPWEKRPTSKAMLLDTGYPGSMVIWNRRHFKQASLVGQLIQKKEESAGIVGYIKFDFGELSFENIPVFIARDVPNQSQKRDGLIGASILAQYHHVIDFTRAKLLMTPVSGSDGQPLQIIDGLIYTPNNEEFDLKTFYPEISTSPTLIIHVSGEIGAK